MWKNYNIFDRLFFLLVWFMCLLGAVAIVVNSGIFAKNNGYFTEPIVTASNGYIGKQFYRVRLNRQFGADRTIAAFENQDDAIALMFKLNNSE